MKRILAIVLVSIVSLIIAIGCKDDGSKTTIIPVSPGSLPYGSNPGDKFTFTADDVSFKMAYVPGDMTFLIGVDDNGDVNDDGTQDGSPTVTVANAYWIGESEVTYELWYTVHAWAIINGYSFANPGEEGHDGTITDPAGEAPTAAKHEPVTTINWRDAMVWCNAATEWYNVKKGTTYTCVYYNDNSYTTPIRNSSDGIYSASLDTTAGSFDNPYIRSDATGFRLLTGQEWELAAKYISDENYDGDIADDGEYYPGNYASGASDDYSNGSATEVVVWWNPNSSSSTHEVMGRASNALGIYDMSGNVWEFCFDWGIYTSNTWRVFRGGSWNGGADVQIGRMGIFQPFDEHYNIGLRIGKNQ